MLRKQILANFEFMGLKLDDARNEGNETVISADDSKVSALKIHTNEELVIALDTFNLIRK
jgi:acetate kinase